MNALIFAKVILIAQALSLGKSLKNRALFRIVLEKSFLFTIVLILFHNRGRSCPGLVQGSAAVDGGH